MTKEVPLLKVPVVVGLFFFLRTVLKNSSLADWQQSLFGAAPVSSSLLFFVLPMVVVLAMRQDTGSGRTCDPFPRIYATRGLRTFKPRKRPKSRSAVHSSRTPWCWQREAILAS